MFDNLSTFLACAVSAQLLQPLEAPGRKKTQKAQKYFQQFSTTDLPCGITAAIPRGEHGSTRPGEVAGQGLHGPRPVK